VKSSNNSYYLRGRGYQPEDLQRVASNVAGMELQDFFEHYVRGTQTLPYDEAFAFVGLHVNKMQLKEPFNAGLSVQFYDPRTPIVDNVMNDSPAEYAGLQSGDQILELAGRPLSKDNWLQTLARYKTGQSVPITVKRNRRTIKTNLVLREPERFEYRVEELAGATAEQKRMRAAWLNGK